MPNQVERGSFIAIHCKKIELSWEEFYYYDFLNIYLDVLLCRLKMSGMGCYYGNLYVGSLAYADVVLLSIT